MCYIYTHRFETDLPNDALKIAVQYLLLYTQRR